MKEYRVTIKHDKGKVTLRAYAENETEARKCICKAEGCPDSAVLKVQNISYYVTMTDKFMSGWGGAEGKTNKFIIEYDEWEKALIIENNAKKRPEMKYININVKKPKYNKANVVESHKTFEQLGEIWKQN